MFNIVALRTACFLAGCMLLILPGTRAGTRLAAQPERQEATAAFVPGRLPVRTQLPMEWRVRTADGAIRGFADWEGRVVVLNLWASWCPPCVRELGSFRALANALRMEGLAEDDVALVLLTPERPTAVARFIRRHLRDLPVYLEQDPLPVELGVRAVPTTWIIDRSGRVAAVHRGAADWHGAAVRALLRELAHEGDGTGCSSRVPGTHGQQPSEAGS